MMQSLTENYSADRKRILVVDDYVPSRRLIVDALDQFGCYEIDEAENGQDALSLVQTSDHYDLVISDVHRSGACAGRDWRIIRQPVQFIVTEAFGSGGRRIRP